MSAVCAVRVGGARGIAMCDVLQNPLDSMGSSERAGQKLSEPSRQSYPPAIYATLARRKLSAIG